jgi:4-coumarate--CoA ligase
VYQIQTARASLLITHAASLPTAEAAARKAGISRERIIVLDSREGGRAKRKGAYPTIEELVKEGLERPPAFVERRLADGEGTKKIAYLCFSSGTTGKPKASALFVCLT